MRAHQINVDGLILNTIIVDSLDSLPGLVNADIGGSIGDQVIDGVISYSSKVSVPQSVTMRQARTILLKRGMLSLVNNAIQEMPGALGDLARIDWEFSQNVERNWHMVEEIRKAIGLSSAQIDAMFIEASLL